MKGIVWYCAKNLTIFIFQFFLQRDEMVFFFPILITWGKGVFHNLHSKTMEIDK